MTFRDTLGDLPTFFAAIVLSTAMGLACVHTMKSVTLAEDTFKTTLCIFEHDVGTPIEQVLIDCQGAIEKNVLDVFAAKKRYAAKLAPSSKPCGVAP